jgi:hypothetical protein
LAALTGARKTKDKEEEYAKVDVGTKLQEVNFSNLDSRLWHRGTAVDELTREGARLKKKGVVKPFVFTDMKKCFRLG